MREVALPPGSNELNASVAACLASILDLDVAALPLPEADHPEPWTVWRNWLAQRGLGLVPIADPARFSWPGPWIAVLPAEGPPAELRAAVAFGSPPGVAWAPLACAGFEAVREGFVVAAADVALWAPSAAVPAVVQSGTVAAILIAAAASVEPERVQTAHAEAGRGLVGDRYHAGGGTFSNPHGLGHELTLVEQETIDEMRAAFPEYRAEDTRRNVVTTGIRLNDLVGQRFRVGEVECIGRRLCEPCAHLDRIAVRGALRHLVHRGGLRADILASGTISVGDAIEALPRAAAAQ